jgi:hypothetical protein
MVNEEQGIFKKTRKFSRGQEKNLQKGTVKEEKRKKRRICKNVKK